MKVIPIAGPDDLKCSVILQCARGWQMARWVGTAPMPCKISEISVMEDDVNGTATMLVVEFPDRVTRDRFVSTSNEKL